VQLTIDQQMPLVSAQFLTVLGLATAVPIEAAFSLQGRAAALGRDGSPVRPDATELPESTVAAVPSTAQTKDGTQVAVEPLTKPTMGRPRSTEAGPRITSLVHHEDPSQLLWLLVGLLSVVILSGSAYVLASRRANAEVDERSIKDIASAPQRPRQGEKLGGDTDIVSKNELDEATLKYWAKTSGMHTVQTWCENYNDHPAGWGALLMIHGVDNVAGRLRSKVENCGLYAGLFLAGSVGGIFAPPQSTVNCHHELTCEIVKRVYMYSLIAGIVSHVLCMLLAMAFKNALNEAARDADVIRMFARGEGFLATVKCQNAFGFGAACNTLSITAVAVSNMGIEVLIVLCIVCPIAVSVYVKTSTLLFRNASIVDYWRSTGHEHDPYDLEVPVRCMKARAQHGLEQ
jgi:hypothetical protein